MSVDYTIERHSLALERPFSIARGTTTAADVVVVRIDGGGTVGVGAAAPSTRYGETINTVVGVLPELLDAIGSVEGPDLLQRAEQAMVSHISGAPAARAAVSIALHDLVAKRVDESLYRRLGLDPTRSLETSYSLGIAPPAETAERAADAVDAGFTTLKVKLGDDRDAAVIAAVRDAVPAATIRVDANEAWTPREALDVIEALAEHDVEFVEQPVAATNARGLRFVYERSPVPIAVDESCLESTDVPDIAGCADVVVVKLMKSGGLREAVRTIHAAHAHGIAVMLGCMVESNASLAAAAHLVPLAEYADLDGSLLLADDPYTGVPLRDARIALSELYRPGTGARR